MNKHLDKYDRETMNWETFGTDVVNSDLETVCSCVELETADMLSRMPRMVLALRAVLRMIDGKSQPMDLPGACMVIETALRQLED